MLAAVVGHMNRPPGPQLALVAMIEVLEPVQIVQMGATVSDLVNTAAIAAYDAIG